MNRVLLLLILLLLSIHSCRTTIEYNSIMDVLRNEPILKVECVLLETTEQYIDCLEEQMYDRQRGKGPSLADNQGDS